MLDRQRVVTTGITTAAVATVALVFWLKPWSTTITTSENVLKPEPVITETKPKGRAVDIVFAVDTTGSMGGLLDGAKRTVWSIANQVREIEKDANLRVGLVAYRDLGDTYVTKDFALSDDLDAVFVELSSYEARGGGDVPENVDAALYDAVHKMKWRSSAKKMIFLVGDAPPSSRGDVPRFDVTARDAARMQIKINTIRAGQDGETASAMQQIASIGNGSFSTIQQDGGVQQVATPYDDKMAQLAAEIDSTAIYYGDGEGRARYESKRAAVAAAPKATAVDRGAYYAKGGGGAAGPMKASEDVVAGVATGAIDVDKLDAESLPSDMREKSKDELKAEVEQRAKKRAAAQKEMADLTKQRDEYIKKNGVNKADAFDSAVKTTLEAQLK